MEGGATKDGVINAKDGVFTRAILMDIPRLKGVEYIEPNGARQNPSKWPIHHQAARLIAYPYVEVR